MSFEQKPFLILFAAAFVWWRLVRGRERSAVALLLRETDPDLKLAGLLLNSLFGLPFVFICCVCFSNLCIQLQIILADWVAPFGNLRVKGCSPLTAAYRSVLRPSSPVCAKASPRCPCFNA